MPTDSVWEAHLTFIAASYHCRRLKFDFKVETYDSWAWLALEEGAFWFRIGRGKGALEGQCNAGDWVLCPPREPLQRRMLAPGSYHFVRFEAPGDVLYTLRGPGTLRDSYRLRANFFALREANSRPQSEGWKAHLLLDTLRCAVWETQQKEATSPSGASMSEPLRFLEENFAAKISLEALAKTHHLSPATFSKRFRAAVGISPQEFLLQKRLDAARTLLLETDLTLDAIAPRCGFANGFYFSRQWTRRFGIAPVRFRRLHQV